jgi:hypothetical protein
VLGVINKESMVEWANGWEDQRGRFAQEL